MTGARSRYVFSETALGTDQRAAASPPAADVRERLSLRFLFSDRLLQAPRQPGSRTSRLTGESSPSDDDFAELVAGFEALVRFGRVIRIMHRINDRFDRAAIQ